MSVQQGIAAIGIAPSEASIWPFRALFDLVRCNLWRREAARPAEVDVVAINRVRQESYDDFIRRLDELLYEDEGLESARARGIRPISPPKD